MRHTKVIATIGPASSSEAVLRGMLEAGVDVCRLNFSHGTHEGHGAVIRLIRRLADEVKRPVAILQDLSGPKIRTGRLRGGEPITVATGDRLTITVGDGEGGPGHVYTTYIELPVAVRRGDTLLLDDGRIQLRVDGADLGEIRTHVVDGGVLGEHKGINAPGVELPSSGLTPKDAADLAFGVEAGVDYVAANGVAGEVANMSLGGSGSNATLEQAVQDASAVVKFALAAGNNSANANNFTPART